MAVNLQKAEFILSAASPKDFLRDGLPQIAFAGRSNVGKSSVINRLLNRKNFARVGAAPGKTTHINYFKIDNAFYLVDLPGYGYAKVSQAEKERWGRLMESYFADSSLMTLGVMIVDSRHKPTADDCTMAQWFRDAGCPLVVAANKLDKLKKSEIEPNLQRVRETLELGEDVPVIPFSAEWLHPAVLFCANGEFGLCFGLKAGIISYQIGLSRWGGACGDADLPSGRGGEGPGRGQGGLCGPSGPDPAPAEQEQNGDPGHPDLADFGSISGVDAEAEGAGPGNRQRVRQWHPS